MYEDLCHRNGGSAGKDDPRFFNEDGYPSESYKNKWPPVEESSEIGVQKWKRKIGNEMEEDEKVHRGAK